MSSCAEQEGFWQQEVLKPCWIPCLHAHSSRVLCCSKVMQFCLPAVVVWRQLLKQGPHSALGVSRMFMSSKNKDMFLKPPSTTFAPWMRNCREYFLLHWKSTQLCAKLKCTLSQPPCAPLHSVGLESQCIHSSEYLIRLPSSLKP